MAILGNRTRTRTLGSNTLNQSSRMGQYQMTDYAQRAESSQTAVSNTAQAQTKKGSKTVHKESDLSTGLKVLTSAATIGSVAADVMKANEMKQEDLKAEKVVDDAASGQARLEDTTVGGRSSNGQVTDKKPNEMKPNENKTVERLDQESVKLAESAPQTPEGSGAPEADLAVNPTVGSAEAIGTGVESVAAIGTSAAATETAAQSAQLAADGAGWMASVWNSFTLF